MTRLIRHLLVMITVTAALFALGRPAFAQSTGPIPKDITYDPHLGARAPLDVELVDEAGRAAHLGDFFHSKRPVVLVLAYYDCPMLCSMVLNGVTAALTASRLKAGEEFELVVVSINPADTPARALAKKASYVRLYDRPGGEAAFHFLTGRESEVRRVADSVGFRYEYDPIGQQFAHAAGAVVLAPSGVISRYFYGIEYSPRDLRLGLVEAADGAIGAPGDKLMLLCFRYDPARGRYGALALTSVRVGGAMTVVALAVSLVMLSRSPRRRLGTQGEPKGRA